MYIICEYDVHEQYIEPKKNLFEINTYYNKYKYIYK